MFYVYVYRDPRPTQHNVPVYVGKGSGRRAWYHWENRVKGNRSFGRFLTRLREAGYEPIIEIAREYETAAEAFAGEVELIALYGRLNRNTGTLFNLTDGGDGCVGVECTTETRQNIGAATARNWKDPEYRAKVVAGQKRVQGTPKARARKSEDGKQLWENQREHMVAAITQARNTPESRAKSAAQVKAQWADPEWAANQRKSIKETANREDVRAKKSEANKAMWADPVMRQKMLDARKRSRLAKNDTTAKERGVDMNDAL